MQIGYLHHGAGYGPYKSSLRTERVNLKHEYADRYLAWYEGRWRRVYIGLKRTWIVYKGFRITIQIDGL